MIRRILRLLLCAVRHPSYVREHRGGVRCFWCSPLRKWNTRLLHSQMTLADLDREAEAQTQLAEGYRNPPEA